MNILITGGSGFIGHQLVLLFLEDPNHHITVVDNFSVGKRSFLPKHPNLEVLPIDIRDRNTLFENLKTRMFDAAYHLAAIHFIPYCDQHPDEAHETNVWGTKNICDLLRLQKNLKLFVNISSAAVYDATDKKLVETDAVVPLDVFGRTKLMGEDLINLFAYETKIPTVGVRLFNVIGRNETNEHLFPSILKQIAEGTYRIKIGNLFPKRTFLDSRDAATALKQFLIQIPSPGHHLVNVGAERLYSVQSIIDMIAIISKRPITVMLDAGHIRKIDRPVLCPSLDKLNSLITWKPQYKLDETIRELLQEAGIF